MATQTGNVKISALTQKSTVVGTECLPCSFQESGTASWTSYKITVDNIADRTSAKLDIPGIKTSISTLESKVDNHLSQIEEVSAAALCELSTRIDTKAPKLTGVTTVTTVNKIPITCPLVIARISTNSSFSLAGLFEPGESITVIIENISQTTDIRVVLPTSDIYMNTGTRDYMYIPKGKQVSITCTCNGETIFVHPNMNIYNPVEYVDLGLSSGTKWANMNIGAYKETDFGVYCQWADTNVYVDGSKHQFNWNTTPYQTTENPTDYTETKFTKYLGSTDSSYKDPSATDEDALKTVLDDNEDPVYIATFGYAKMPTSAQISELLNGTTNEWVSINGVPGRKFTSKTNGNYIFFPAAGDCNGSSVINVGSYVYVWSRSLNASAPCNACNLTCYASGACLGSDHSRCNGFSLRGVL